MEIKTKRFIYPFNNKLGLASVISACSDGEDGNMFFRLDRIVASLELAYIDGIETLDWYHDCNEPIDSLVKRYFY